MPLSYECNLPLNDASVIKDVAGSSILSGEFKSSSSFGWLIASIGQSKFAVLQIQFCERKKFVITSILVILVKSGSFCQILMKSRRFCQILAKSRSFYKILPKSGSFCQILANSGSFCQILANSGSFGQILAYLESFWRKN